MYKRIRFYSIAIFLVILANLCAGCVKTTDTAEDYTAQDFPSVESELVAEDGEDDVITENPYTFANSTSDSDYPITTKTTNASYWFSSDNQETNVSLVRNAEIIIENAKEQFDLEPYNPRFYFSSDSSKSTISHKKNQAVINPADVSQLGGQLFYISKGLLPSWLCTGIELYWLDNNGVMPSEIDKEIDVTAWYTDSIEAGLPELTDEWFVPGLIVNELRASVPSAALAFIKYLDDNGILNNLVSMFLDENKIWDAEKLRIKMWNEFTGLECVTPENIAFRRWYYPYPSTNRDTDFYVQMPEGKFYYTRGEWTRERVYLYAEYANDAIRFVKDWFGDESDTPIEVMYVVPRGSTLGGTSSPIYNLKISGAYIYDSFHYPLPIAVVHETVHAIMANMNIRNNFPVSPTNPRDYFEEGLCDAITLIYCLQTDFKDIYGYYKVQFGYANEEWRDMLNEAYEKFAGKPYSQEPFEENFDLMAYKKAFVYYYIEALQLWDTSVHGKLSFLQSYDTAANFIMYLLDNGTKEEFMEAYCNFRKFEVIYGKDAEGMMLEWLDNLGFER